METLIALIAIFALPILMMTMLAIFERRDGQTRYIRKNGRLVRRSRWEHQAETERREARMREGLILSKWKNVI